MISLKIFAMAIILCAALMVSDAAKAKKVIGVLKQLLKRSMALSSICIFSNRSQGGPTAGDPNGL